MSDDHEDRPSPDAMAQPPVDTGRRRFLGGAAVLGVGATLSACGNGSEAPGKPVARPLTPQELDKALHDQVKTVVVIYAENRSFNNLFADFPGVEKPLSALSAADTQQRDRDGSLLTTLPPGLGRCAASGPAKRGRGDLPQRSAIPGKPAQRAVRPQGPER